MYGIYGEAQMFLNSTFTYKAWIVANLICSYFSRFLNENENSTKNLPNRGCPKSSRRPCCKK